MKGLEHTWVWFEWQIWQLAVIYIIDMSKKHALRQSCKFPHVLACICNQSCKKMNFTVQKYLSEVFNYSWNIMKKFGGKL